MVHIVCVVVGVVGRGRGVPGAGAPHHPQPLLQHRDARAHQPRLQREQVKDSFLKSGLWFCFRREPVCFWSRFVIFCTDPDPSINKQEKLGFYLILSSF